MSSSADIPQTPLAGPPKPALGELFLAFAMVSVMSFGGALPWSRRMIVERKRWMTAQEFNEAFALSQFLPGPNTINFTMVFGRRFGGVPGAAAAFLGLLGPPLVFIILLGVAYARYGQIEWLSRALSGVASAAAGLLMAAAAKMSEPMLRKRLSWAPAIAILAFIGVALMRWPLPTVFLSLAPVSIALAWFLPEEP